MKLFSPIILRRAQVETTRLLFAVCLVAALGALPLRTAAALESVDAWQTTADLSSKLTPLPKLSFAPDMGSATYVITVNESVQYQQMDGFGVSLTDASAYNLQTRLSPAKRAEVMANLFGPEGISMSMLRQPMGSCDFNRDLYSYDDTAGDTTLTAFSIARDEQYIIPSIKDALARNPRLKVMASPWSPPAWMKTSASMIGGAFLQADAVAYAQYFVKFINAYKADGIEVFAVTPQNEPGYSSNLYPGMLLSAAEQAHFISAYLGPAFSNAGLSTKILCFDHNYDAVAIPEAILSDSAASPYIAGTAFHHYGGDPSGMSTLHALYPNKDIWFTEGGLGDWGNNTFANISFELMGIPRNWSKSIVFWNAALDEKDGPSIIGDHNSNKGMITVSSTTMDSVTYNLQYYYLGHLSKFVMPGAYRIDSNTYANSVETVAFKNPDQSLVLVAANRSSSSQDLKVKWGPQSFSATLPASSFTTFKWSSQPVLPTIDRQPTAQAAAAGSTAQFAVAATNAASYQWYKDGAALAGATASTYTISSVQASDVGSYNVVATNVAGSVSSGAAGLSTTVAYTDKLVNISTRSYVGTGGDVQIAGFIIGGSQAKRVFIRALGPQLKKYGINSGYLVDPTLTLYSGGTVLLTNDNWGDDSIAITQATALTHAVPFDPASTDAAISTILQPGAYTAIVSGKNGGTGTALVEVYEADGIDSAAKLVNISTRSLVKSGDNVQIAGVIAGGSRPKNVLIRANGPQLGKYGVIGVLDDPVLQLYSGSTKIAENDDWGTDGANITAATSAAQIPPFAANSKDAALLATLSPGLGYTAIVSGKGSSTGVVLIEVYEMP